MRQPANLLGLKFNRWTVEARAISRINRNGTFGEAQWFCRCDCGTEQVITASGLKRGATKSCGCWNREVAARRQWRHGFRDHPLYSVWRDMIVRCSDPRRHNFNRYGGRGIRVCNQWRHDAKAFITWALAAGYQQGLQIDRIDNNGNYSPDNCRFVTCLENARNRPQYHGFVEDK